jgi:hypothetical protein
MRIRLALQPPTSNPRIPPSRPRSQRMGHRHHRDDQVAGQVRMVEPAAPLRAFQSRRTRRHLRR